MQFSDRNFLPAPEPGAVLLPDGQVLVVKCAQGSAGSTAVLLPDATILVAGPASARRQIQIIEPAYLSNGPRPVILSAPEAVAHGEEFPLRLGGDAPAASACLVRPAVSRTFPSENLYIQLSLRQIGPDLLSVTAPPLSNAAPPGFYMLFVLSPARVPSVARFLQLH